LVDEQVGADRVADAARDEVLAALRVVERALLTQGPIGRGLGFIDLDAEDIVAALERADIAEAVRFVAVGRPARAARIFREWETEAENRRSLERWSVKCQVIERIGGRVLAFVFAVSAPGAVAYCASIGQTVAGCGDRWRHDRRRRSGHGLSTAQLATSAAFPAQAPSDGQACG
jgi:hypothetical protein